MQVQIQAGAVCRLEKIRILGKERLLGGPSQRPRGLARVVSASLRSTGVVWVGQADKESLHERDERLCLWTAWTLVHARHQS